MLTSTLPPSPTHPLSPTSLSPSSKQERQHNNNDQNHCLLIVGVRQYTAVLFNILLLKFLKFHTEANNTSRRSNWQIEQPNCLWTSSSYQLPFAL